MHKILILSDSHGLTDEIAEIEKNHQVDYMIHCGDSELDMDAPELQNFIKVGGNCDIDSRYPEEQTIEINNRICFITHGHLQGVKRGLMNLTYRAMERDATVVCFGHTHFAGADRIGNQLFINPGSIRLPNNRPEKTYAILEWGNTDDVKVLFYTTTGELVEDLTYQTVFSE